MKCFLVLQPKMHHYPLKKDYKLAMEMGFLKDLNRIKVLL